MSRSNRVDPPAGDGAAGEWSTVGDRALLEALRDGEPLAVDEFIRRFEPLVVRYTRWLRVPAVERSHWAAELLYDVATRLARGPSAMPRQLAAYVVAACKYKARRDHATKVSEQARLRDAAEDPTGGGEYVALAACSEGSIRSSRGPDWESAPMSPVLERLVGALKERMSANEWQLLSLLAAQASYTMIANTLGIRRPAAVSRVQRLRAKLLKTAMRFGAGLNDSDRTELARFLRRAGALAPGHLAALVAPQASQRGEEGPSVVRPEPLRSETPTLKGGRRGEE